MLARIRAARQNESGFTLIELLIVIVILGVLSGIVIFSVSGITDRGRAQACRTDLSTVKVASEAYNASNKTPLPGGGYATTGQLLANAFLQSKLMPTTVVYVPPVGLAAGGAPAITSSAACQTLITANP